MARGMKFIAALVVFIITINESIQESIPGLFPKEETLIYNYYGDVKAGIIEPAAYASQYSISGKLHIKHDTSDPKYQHSYLISLQDVKTGLHNGNAAHYEPTKILMPILEAARVIEDPFIVVYDDFGQVEGVKIPEQEPVWSKNMKMAMASMLQLDLKNMKIDGPIKPHSFMVQEKSIHGDCWTSYDVHAKLPTNDQQDSPIVVTKFALPKNCTNYNIHVFDQMDAEKCDVPRVVPINMAARRLFELSYKNNSILIEKLIAHGGVNYFPWLGRSEAHYVLNNASFILDKVVTSSEISLPEVDFKNMPLTTDISYQRPQGYYAENAAVDITNGRNVVKQDVVISKLMNMLNEAVDYLEKNHIDAKEPDSINSQTINRILDIMSFMEISSFEKVFAQIRNVLTDRDEFIRSLFINIIPQVGTPASNIFIWNLVKNKEVTNGEALSMLAKMAFYVRVPNEDFLIKMEPLLYSSGFLHPELRKISILSFATMIYKTFENMPVDQVNDRLDRYLTYFYDGVINEPSYTLKIGYLMAIGNVQVGKIYKLLAPIIRGDISVSKNPSHIRLMAIWAISKSVSNDYNAAHDLLWPIMSDYTLHLKLRIAAYDILIRQAPSMENILHIYWFMVYEKSEHLYNYHHTTIKSLANSLDPCDAKLRELTTKIMRFTKIHQPVPHELSASYMIDSIDRIYGHGESFRISLIHDEPTGNLEVIYLEHTIVEGHKKVNHWAIYLNAEGIHDFINQIEPVTKLFSITDKNILNILKKAAESIAPVKKMHVDAVLIIYGRAISAFHINEDLIGDFVGLTYRSLLKMWNNNVSGVKYQNIYEQTVISEMGLPVILETKTPTVYSIKLIHGSTPQGSLKVGIDAKLWHHQDYAMSIYNPLVNIWHSIRRSSVLNANLPVQFIFGLDFEPKILKLQYPILDAEELSILGIMTHTKDITVVTDNEDNVLETACPNCTKQVVVSKGEELKNKFEQTIDLRALGLQITAGIFDCENEITPVLINKEWVRALFKERKNSWNSILLHSVLGIRQQLKNSLISPSMGSCGKIIKISPSTTHPTSHLDMSFKVSYEDLDMIDKTPSFLEEHKLNVLATLDAVSASTNTSVESWYLNLGVDIPKEHLKNSLKAQIRRVTSENENLKICIDGQKIYSPIVGDPLKVGLTKEETNGKLIISMDHADDDQCHRNETLVTITIKGELTNEQKKLFIKDSINSACSKDINNPLYKSSSILLPKTVNCLDETIRHTTLRKYTCNIAHKNVPRNIASKIFQLEDIIKSEVLPHIKYTNENFTEQDTAKIIIGFPMNLKTVNVSVITPHRSYDLIEVDLNIENNPPRLNGFGSNYNKNLWGFPLDNTRFDMKFLALYSLGRIKMCSVYPKVVLTVDGGEIPYLIPPEWILISGDCMYERFAIFVKNIDDKLALRIYRGDDVVEMISSDNSTIQVKINNEIIDSTLNEPYVPKNAQYFWTLKITKLGEHVISTMENEIIVIGYTEGSVSLMIDQTLQGRINGLCGSMDGTYKNKIPKTYRLTQDSITS
ncbi:LOW QUALITY PROTEIN: larval-specific very high density lipoprotein [Cotesia typhae]|uniref:LOW QUALITY PROTEIN: larval-specific very high density lipoprotein n=1 Tax=Cotesia typhae TaxID=2053667 RepID=UPI003D681173